MDLLVAQHALMLAEEVSDPREDRAPDRGPNRRVEDELRERHAVQPGGDRNEVADHGKQTADQRADLAMLGKKALATLEIFLAEQNVLAIASDQRPADPLGAVIIGECTDDA